MQFGSTEQVKIVLLFVIAAGLVLLNLQIALAFRFSRVDRFMPDAPGPGMTAGDLAAALSRCTVSAHNYGSGMATQIGQAYQLDVTCEDSTPGADAPFMLPPADPSSTP